MAPGLLQSVVGGEEAGNTGVREFKQGDDFKKMVGDSGGVVVRFFQSGEGVVEAEQNNWKKLEEEWVHKVWDKRVYGMQFVQVDCTMHSKVCEIEVRDEEKKAMRELPIVQVYVKGNKHASIATKSIGYGELDAELKKAAVFKNKEADYDRIITSKAEFDQLVLGSNGKKDGDAVNEMWLVNFYSPTCRYSKILLPEWKKLEDNKGKEMREKLGIRMAKVNCLSDHEGLCGEQKVDGYPTIFLYVNGNRQEECMVGSVYEKLAEYVDELPKRFAQKTKVERTKTQEKVQELSGETLEEEVARDNVFVFFFGPNCPFCRAMMKAYDEELIGAMRDTGIKIAKINCQENHSACAARKIKGYPTLRLFYNGGQSDMQGGDRSAERMREFILGEMFMIGNKLSSVEEYNNIKLWQKEGGETKKKNIVYFPAKIKPQSEESNEEYIKRNSKINENLKRLIGEYKLEAEMWSTRDEGMRKKLGIAEDTANVDTIVFERGAGKNQVSLLAGDLTDYEKVERYLITGYIREAVYFVEDEKEYEKESGQTGVGVGVEVIFITNKAANGKLDPKVVEKYTGFETAATMNRNKQVKYLVIDFATWTKVKSKSKAETETETETETEISSGDLPAVVIYDKSTKRYYSSSNTSKANLIDIKNGDVSEIVEQYFKNKAGGELSEKYIKKVLKDKENNNLIKIEQVHPMNDNANTNNNNNNNNNNVDNNTGEEREMQSQKGVVSKVFGFIFSSYLNIFIVAVLAWIVGAAIYRRIANEQKNKKVLPLHKNY